MVFSWFSDVVGGGGGGGDLLHLFHNASMYYLTEKRPAKFRVFSSGGTEGTPLRPKIINFSIMAIYKIDLYFLVFGTVIYVK